MQVDNQIANLVRFQNLSKGRHTLAAVDNLPPNLRLRSPSSHAGEIGALMPADMVDGVAMLASAHLEDRSAARALLVRESKRERRADHKQEGYRQPEFH